MLLFQEQAHNREREREREIDRERRESTNAKIAFFCACVIFLGTCVCITCFNLAFCATQDFNKH